MPQTLPREMKGITLMSMVIEQAWAKIRNYGPLDIWSAITPAIAGPP
jgi:hypothetical protein